MIGLREAATQGTYSSHWGFTGNNVLQHQSRYASMAMFRRCVMGSC